MRNLVKFSMLLALVAVATTASAAELEFHGYGRAGIGLNTQGGGQISFALPGSDRKFRLGNESDYVIEPDFVYKFTTLEDKSAWGIDFMPAMYRKYGNQSTGFEDLPLYAKQFYFFGNNVPQLLNGQIWAGRRYIERLQTGIDDAFTENEDGDGAGIQDMDLGFAKWTVNVLMNPNNSMTDKTVKLATHFTGIQTFSKDAALQIWGRLYLQSKTTGATTDLNSTSAIGKRDPGFSIAAYHTWNLGDLGSNFVGFKYQKNGYGQSADNGVGSGQQAYWIEFQHGINFPTAKTSLDVLAKYRSRWAAKVNSDSVVDTSIKTNSFIVGARTDTHLSGPFRFLLEAGYDYDTVTHQKAQSLLKLTAALAVSGGNDPWSRPTFRLFYTEGIWNDAAKGQMGHVWINQNYTDNNYRVSAPFDTKTNGGTYGIQAEGWW